MTTRHDPITDAPPVTVLEFAGRQPETEETLASLSPESQAALRQFSVERTMAYGVDYADVVELRGRVVAGESWQEVATDLANTALTRAEAATGDARILTRSERLRQASALLRMSQVMMLTDTEERLEIYAGAAELYDQARLLRGDRERIRIETDQGTLAGWLSPAAEPVGSAVVVGGVEGWSMDFETLGDALAARGIDALMLDGPGQGETRFAHRHYLTPMWRDSYSAAFDMLEKRTDGQPIAVIGNSMGGSFAMAAAAHDTRIRACVDNGGISDPYIVPPEIGTFFWKMAAAANTNTAEHATDVWRSVTPMEDGPNAGYPLLVVHGGRDPLVSSAMAEDLLRRAPTDDKEMVVFSDGDHCIYNHRTERDAVISDWTRARLAGNE